MPTFTIATHHCSGGLWALRQEEIEGIQIEKEEGKLSVFVGDMIYIENLVESTQKSIRANTRIQQK